MAPSSLISTSTRSSPEVLLVARTRWELRQQIQTGIAVSGDGGVPVFHRAVDGGAGEVSQVVPAMQALQRLAGPARVLMIGDYVAARDAGKDPEQRGRWHVREDVMTLAGPRERDPVFTLRRILVHSSARAAAAVTARTKRLDRAAADLDRLTRGLARRRVRVRCLIVGRAGPARSPGSDGVRELGEGDRDP